jgi:hypothetical protein
MRHLKITSRIDVKNHILSALMNAVLEINLCLLIKGDFNTGVMLHFVEVQEDVLCAA